MTKTECLLCGTDWVFMCSPGYILSFQAHAFVGLHVTLVNVQLLACYCSCQNVRTYHLSSVTNKTTAHTRMLGKR
jgi:hypothetical protein